MDGESRRSREAVRNSIRTYGVKVMDPAALPLKKTKELESQESVSRFSEKPHYETREGHCRECINRMPFATLMACVITLTGVMVFSISAQRNILLTNKMITEVLMQNTTRIATVDVAFIILEISTGFNGVMILIIGILSTGETRNRVYAYVEGRMSGKFCCAVLMFFTSILLIIWLLVYFLFCVLFYVSLISTTVCEATPSEVTDETCLHLPGLLIYSDLTEGDIKFCGKAKIKAFCKDFIEKANPTCVICGLANFIIVVGLVLFLICLSANYARIRCEAKYQEIEELRRCGGGGGGENTSQDRF